MAVEEAADRVGLVREHMGVVVQDRAFGVSEPLSHDANGEVRPNEV